MSAPTTIPAPTVSSGSSTNAGSYGKCWKATVAGTWVEAPAPWLPGKAQEWVNTNAGTHVLTTHHRDCLDFDSPAIEVWEVKGVDHSSSSAFYVGLFQGLSKWRRGEAEWTEFYFLLEPPAIAKLIAEFTPLLALHPQELRTPPKAPREPSKPKATKPKRRPLAHVSAV
ncbi:hypothetical protein GobsT_23190 [Gemmata obscuriglobus]|uniref:Uncharacterized protein n=1 Tax=Gemmata obscuriglobus TaxID=114 RepID=A0A2Z3H6Z9_9BACT|nr:hypothetical protein [Gemmata obscuriglobus]AWM39366.1 hypothetical protein C1280_21845 [Gemmata obscuriglobus]QEG27563.1 hypothetical protein GobsT_23190 [Gemmata obscuriglobus]VTS04647.1 unnamed protein product [Gemmata obscuriglobus UQM 2246]